MTPLRRQGLFDELPFGSEFTQEEVELAKALKFLDTHAISWRGRLNLATRAFNAQPDQTMASALKRMGLSAPATWRERLSQRMVAAGLRAIRTPI
jgi:hypothetical protein